MAACKKHTFRNGYCVQCLQRQRETLGGYLRRRLALKLRRLGDVTRNQFGGLIVDDAAAELAEAFTAVVESSNQQPE